MEGVGGGGGVRVGGREGAVLRRFVTHFERS